MQIIKYKNYLDEALEVKSPKPKKRTNQAPLYAHGKRLTKSQVDQIFESFDLTKLADIRNYALMYTAFMVALRLSELQRLTLNDIQQTERGYVTTVRGKGNNEDPTNFEAQAYINIRIWVESYNAGLSADDPRRITNDTPIWQPLTVGDNYKKNHEASNGITNDGISRIVQRISNKVLGFKISPHDCRRSYTAIGRSLGIDLDYLQQQLRHKSVATTQIYAGPIIDLTKSSLSSRITFAAPPTPTQQLRLNPDDIDNLIEHMETLSAAS